MLSQMQRLSVEADGRYATDEELKFLATYLRSYDQRLQTYQKLQSSETTLIQQVYDRVRTKDPNTFRNGNTDHTSICKRDMSMNLRYAALAMLLDDTDTLREKHLFWCQTIMRACGIQRKCNLIYSTMQEVTQQQLDPAQARLINGVLEQTQRLLGGV
ncbi:MAG: phycobilisome protein [Alkalinema sp. CACIAM 70d]|uniref:phycobilisome protein n=1 Tax=Alkalinema pantanalense TaxID=1620705 RepID=UPI000B6EE0B8|nr:MAG: phycobilisome protein [Alkalinema sp. CACIAM 70d]